MSDVRMVQKKPVRQAAEKPPISVPGKPKITKKKKNPLGTIFSLFLVAAVIAVCVLVVTNDLFGGRGAIISFLAGIDPAYSSFQQKELELEAFRIQLSAREESVRKKEESLEKKEAEIEEKTLALQQEVVNSSLETYLESLSDERLDQFKQIGKIYSNMDPEKAADALSEIGSFLDMAVVVFYMDPGCSALVLGSMEAELAAKITESMLK